MEIKRKRDRIAVNIPVTPTTVLDSVEGRIIDLSANGAQVVGASVPTGTKFHIDYLGQTVFAQCMWSEIDRMGVRFPFSISDGPLYDALMMATPEDQPASHGYMQAASLTAMPVRRPAASTFGRRSFS